MPTESDALLPSGMTLGEQSPLDRQSADIPPAASHTRWLDEEEQDAWRSFLAMARHMETTSNRQLQEDAGIPHGYYQILAMLSEAKDRTLRMSKLADITMTSQSRMSHAIKALESRGWVERRPVESDRRGHDAVLTDAGLAAIVAMAPGHVDEVRRQMIDRLTREQLHQISEIARAVVPAADLPLAK